MKNLHILIRTHSDYDEYEFEVVGVTDQPHVAHAFLQIGGSYWSHDVEIVTLNVLQDFPDVKLGISEWLEAANPLCECGHRFLWHRRANHTGSCTRNVNYGDVKHKCKGFKLAKEQPAVYRSEEITDRRQQ